MTVLSPLLLLMMMITNRPDFPDFSQMSVSGAENGQQEFRRGVTTDTDRDLVFRFASSPEIKWEPRLHNLDRTKKFCEKHSFHVDSVCSWIRYWTQRCMGLTEPPDWLAMRIGSRKRKASTKEEEGKKDSKVDAPSSSAAGNAVAAAAAKSVAAATAAAAAAAAAAASGGGDGGKDGADEDGELEPPSSDDDVDPGLPPEKKQRKSESLVELLYRIDKEEQNKLEEWHAKVDLEYRALAQLKENRELRAAAYTKIKAQEAELESIKRALNLPI